jgi:D-3-phosphoglycerate dehydrogenase
MKVLVTSRSFGREAPEAIQRLESAGIEVVRAAAPNPAPEELARQIEGFDALVVGNDTVNETVLAADERLKVVHMNGTGLDGIDVEAATRHAVLVCNAPGANRNAVAELTVALMLDAARSVHRYASALDDGRWERSRGVEVTGKTVGILGLGHVGKRVVELLAGFEIEAIGFDAFPDIAWSRAAGVELCTSADDVFARSDFLVLTLPLAEDTRHIVNEASLSLMKPTAYLINAARGGLVETEALRRAVVDRRIAGAALDAYDHEPLPPDSPLLGLGLLLTPHLAASSRESAASVSHIVTDHLIDILLTGGTGRAVNASEIAIRQSS